VASGCGDGLALRRVQRVEQVGDIHRAILRERDPRIASSRNLAAGAPSNRPMRAARSSSVWVVSVCAVLLAGVATLACAGDAVVDERTIERAGTQLQWTS
jgi:hypothetical protein